MLLGQIFQSTNSWAKLSRVNMKPKIALTILRYSKAVSAEYDLVEEKRKALIHEITKTEPGTEAKIEPGSDDLAEYVNRFNEILQLDSSVEQIQLKLSEAVDAVDEKDETLTVQDLAVLEPFFDDYVQPEQEKTE